MVQVHHRAEDGEAEDDAADDDAACNDGAERSAVPSHAPPSAAPSRSPLRFTPAVPGSTLDTTRGLGPAAVLRTPVRPPMLKSFFGSRGARVDEPPKATPATSATSAAAPAAAGGVHASGSVAAALPPLPDLPAPALPPAVALGEQWRAQVARTTIALRERYPHRDSPRDHAERLLVKLAVDLELAVWQPSPAAQEALAIIGDPDGDPAALVRVLQRDAALEQGVLRLAGCALFAGGAPASVDDAVRRLGAQGVPVAVLAGLAESLQQRTGGPYEPMAQQVWAHLVRTGPRARAMARAFGVATQEAYLLGLVHDVGKLVLFDLLSALHQELRRDLQLPDGLGEEALDLLHEPIGGLALLRWGVDARLAWAVANHHRREPVEGRESRSELLYVAERTGRGRAPDVERLIEEGGLRTPGGAHCLGPRKRGRCREGGGREGGERNGGERWSVRRCGGPFERDAAPREVRFIVSRRSVLRRIDLRRSVLRFTVLRFTVTPPGVPTASPRTPARTRPASRPPRGGSGA